jgi:hypothetical protein
LLPVVLLNVMNGADVRVVQDGTGSRFLEETASLGVIPLVAVGEEFQGYGAGESQILGFVDDPHAAFTELLEDLIVRNDLADHGNVTGVNDPYGTKFPLNGGKIGEGNARVNCEFLPLLAAAEQESHDEGLEIR